MFSIRTIFIICLCLSLVSTFLTMMLSRTTLNIGTLIQPTSVTAACIVITIIVFLQRKSIGYKLFVQNRPVEKEDELKQFLQIEQLVPAKNYVLVKSKGKLIGHAYASIVEVRYLDDLDREKKLIYLGNFARILSTLSFTFELIPRITPVSTEAYIHNIHKEIEDLRLTLSAEGSMANPSREARLKHLEKLSARLLASEGAMDVGFVAHIVVEGKNEDTIVKQLELNMKSLISVLESGLGVRVVRLEGHQMLEAIQEFFRASGTNHPSKPLRLLAWEIAYLIPFTRPKMPPANKLLGGVYLGRTDTGSIVCLDLNKYANPHIAVLGKSGFGKSITVKTFISRLFDLTGIPILIIDYTNEYRDYVENRSGTIIDMRRDRINPFELGGSILVDRIRQVVDAFTKTCDLKTINQRNEFANYVTKAYATKGFKLNDPETWKGQPPTLADVIKLMTDELSKLPALKQLTIQSLIARLQVLASGPFGIFGQSTVSIEQLTQDLTCIDLSKVTSNNLKDLIAWTFLQYLDTMMRLEGVVENVKLVIVLDEAWKLCKDEDSLPVAIIKEGRKYGYALIVSTQDVIDVAEPILSNAGTVIIHRTEHPRYLNFFKRAYDLTETEISRIRNLLIGEALIKLSIDPKPFFVKVEMETPTREDETNESEDQVCTPKPDNEQALIEKSGKVLPPIHADLSPAERELLEYIAANIPDSIRSCYEQMGVSHYQGNKAKNELMEKQLIQTVKLPRTKCEGRRPYTLALTAKGMEAASKLEIDIKMTTGREGGVIHRYLLRWAAQEFKNKGFKVEVEKPVGESRTIDLVVNNSLAVEIETGYSDIPTNIEKLQQFNQKVIICADRATKRRVQKLAEQRNAAVSVIEALELTEFLARLKPSSSAE